MIASRDLKAVEAAELEALRDRADARREELAETLVALRHRLTDSASLRGWASRAAEWAVAQAGHATWHAVRHSAPGTAAAAGASKAVQGARAAGRRKTVLAGVPAAAAVTAGGWWLLRRGLPRR